MPLSKSSYKSTLTPLKLTALLKKIKALSAAKASRLVIAKGSARYQGDELASFTIDETLSVGCLVFDDGAGAQTYDKADIVEIKRLRTKKYKIVLKPNANPAL